MGILYLLGSVLLLAILLVAVIIYVLITKRYKVFWLVPIVAVLLYLGYKGYVLYWTIQTPVLKAISFRESNVNDPDSIIPQNHPSYVFEFSSDKRIEEFPHEIESAFLSPYIKEMDYESIFNLGEDSVLDRFSDIIFKSITIDSINNTKEFNYDIIFIAWNDKSMEMLSGGDSLYFRLFLSRYLGPMYEVSSISVPPLKKKQ